MSENKRFADFCIFYDDSDKSPSDNLFDGVKSIKTEETHKFEPRIFFPRGYRPNSSLNAEEKDTELKADFFRLLSIISNDSEPNAFPNNDKDDKKIDFPIHAFFSVIQYYLDFGYFVETEHIYKKGWSGKINWSKTIKSIKPQVIQDEDGRYNLVYLDLITRRSNYKEDNLITLIHKYCALESARIIGPLLGVWEDDLVVPEIDFDPELFAEVLRDKIASTFNDKFLELFQSMLTMVNYLNKKENRVRDDTEVSFGYEKFDHAWEMMVDKIFGTVVTKSKYNPHLRFVVENDRDPEGLPLDDDGDTNKKLRSTLRPDTIMIRDGNTFVLDSKYYKYGTSSLPADLPGAESVCKQMAYAEYVKKKNPTDNVYNVFIMPCCAADVSRLFPKAKVVENSIYGMSRVGYIYGDWKQMKETAREDAALNAHEKSKFYPYHKIHCILLDMKSVIRNFSNNKEAQEELARLIKS